MCRVRISAAALQAQGGVQLGIVRMVVVVVVVVVRRALTWGPYPPPPAWVRHDRVPCVPAGCESSWLCGVGYSLTPGQQQGWN